MATLLPKLFVGSSSESSVFAEAIQTNLKSSAEVEPWLQLEFPLSRTTIEALEQVISEVDFAVFVFVGDDKGNIRGVNYETVRDNVILELGIAIGILGRDRTFIVQSSATTAPLRIPTDLLGLTTAQFDASKYSPQKGNAPVTIGPASNAVRTAINMLGKRHRSITATQRRIHGVLGRGSTESISSLADAGLRVADRRHELMRDLKKAVLSREIVPSKYLYWFPHGTAHWLDICAKESYVFYKSSLKQLRKVADQLASKLVQATGTAEIDLVSVGSGDGVKDNMLLRALSKDLRDGEYIYYYPVDISDALIARAAPQAIGGGLKPEKFRLKALVSDYAELPSLAKFYEERPNPNLFSVLGNTVGNAEEQTVFEAIGNSMLEGDLVLFEINIGEPDLKDPLLRDRANLEHDFSPLAAFNVPFNPDRIHHFIETGTSIVPGTKSIVTECDDVTIDNTTVDNVKLAIVHHYDIAEFSRIMIDRLNVEIIAQFNSHGVALLLGQRKK